jgi:outer membrane protein OmpU
MKKQLLTTTALVAAGVLTITGSALAQKPTLSLGGSTEQIFGVGQNDDAFDAANGQRIGFDQHSDTEVHFNGSVTLDNGIKIRTRVELEGNSADTTAGRNSNVINGAPGTASNGTGGGSADTIDENWMRISGSFGEVRLGSGDAAAQAMTTGYLGTWATGVGQNLAFDTTDWISRTAATVRAGNVHRVDASSDAEHVSYFTPRFAGFQAGISYIPSAREDVNNQRELTAGADNDGWSLGLNFDRKFGGIGVGIAGGYATANESTANLDNPEIWGIGGRVDFAGFRVAMSWLDTDDQGTALNTAANGQETFEAGVRYIFGPNAVSAQYQKAETQSRAAARNNDEAETFWLAYRRTLGPGVFWKVSAMFADFDDGLAGAAAGNSNDGQALTTSIQIRF